MPTLRYWMETEVHVYAFSIAANGLLSLFPFLIISLSLGKMVFGEAPTLAAIDAVLHDYFPDEMAQFLHRNAPASRTPELVSMFLLLFTANGIFEPLEVALNRVWGIRKNRSFVGNQAISLVLIFGCGGLALLSLGFGAFELRNAGALPAIGWIMTLFIRVASFPLVVLCLLLVYRFLPNGKTPMERVLPAAIGVGVLFEVLKTLIRLLGPAFQRKLAAEYGVFAHSALLIFVGFLSSMLVLAGAEWAARGHRLDSRELPTGEVPAGELPSQGQGAD
jgi:membrane protein